MRRRLIILAGSIAAMVVVAFLVPLAFLVRDLARDRALSTAERNTQIVAQNLSLVPSSDVARIEAVLATVAARSDEQM
ncbi:MAG: two-component sensor histidine kinase, partial [Acidimicrobiia bacterium]|nr:two-component sensor histidine kinase [Acidimicrobiia bacterium]